MKLLIITILVITYLACQPAREKIEYDTCVKQCIEYGYLCLDECQNKIPPKKIRLIYSRL